MTTPSQGKADMPPRDSPLMKAWVRFRESVLNGPKVLSLFDVYAAGFNDARGEPAFHDGRDEIVQRYHVI